jgi:RNA recognition motif-containing protein
MVQGSASKSKDIKVREIWVGNLPDNMSESKLYRYFFIHGEIEKMEVHSSKNFGFIRFKLTNCAKRAWDQFNGYMLEDKKLKVVFSDYTRRDNIQGDLSGYDLTEDNCRTLYVSY